MELLYDANKYNIEEELILISQSLISKVETQTLRTTSNEPQSIKVDKSFITTASDKILQEHHSFAKLKELFFQISLKEVTVQKEIKSLENFGDTNTLYETSLKVKRKNKKKQMLKELENLKKDIINQLMVYFFNLSSKLFTFFIL